MQLLSTTTITAAISTPLVTAVAQPGNGAPRNLTAQFNFTYGSGGTTVDAYLQTSLDGGATWTDICNFHATTASLRKAVNLSAATPVTTPQALTDGSIAANTSQDGMLGPIFRLKYQSAGTYAGATTLRVDLQSIDIAANPS